MELAEDERCLAAALNVYIVWYQDCFASGSDRDPASIFELFLRREDADSYAAELRRKAGPESFERYDTTGPRGLLVLYDERADYPETHYLVTEELVRTFLGRPAQ